MRVGLYCYSFFEAAMESDELAVVDSYRCSWFEDEEGWHDWLEWYIYGLYEGF